MKGWVPVWRKMFRREHWLAPTKTHPACRWGAWTFIVQMAQHDRHEHVETLHRGELLLSVRWLADRLKWSRSATQRFLTRLETETMIETVRGTPNGTVYRIVNYDTYAISRDTKRDTNRDRQRDATGTRPGQEQEQRINNGKQPSTTGEPVLALRGLYGWNGSEGTDPVLLKAFADPADRDRCLSIAIQRLEVEGKDPTANQRVFRKVLDTVIQQQSTNGDDMSHWED